jgi:hypothetical protein
VNATQLTSSAKEALRKTVRGLRAALIPELAQAADREYHLSVDLAKAKLPEARRRRRERLEEWAAERARSEGKGAKKAGAAALRDRYLAEAAEEAAYTLLNRLVLIRILEHHAVLGPAVLTGGAKSPGYEKEFLGYAGPLAQDDTRGFAPLLDVIYGELSLELPGLFGQVGLTALFPIPAALLRQVVEALNDPDLESAWGDDTTLGWVYQYWNDPEREALDKKIADGGKIEPHEIASKTQMFTERYMVEWLLQNSLGLTWLAICKKNGWTAEAEAVLPILDERRAAFRARREAGEVALDALMPIATDLEGAWKYYVPQPIPADAVEKAPASIRDLRLLDPACGSGHFLVIAFDLLARLHEEEARHRGEEVSPESIAEAIVGQNLFGIDLDARAIQIAAAALWLKAKLYAPNARLAGLNLVAPTLRLGRLPADDPALARLQGSLEKEVGLPRELTTKLVQGLAGVDHLGSLLRVDRAVEDAFREAQAAYEKEKGWQGKLGEAPRLAPPDASSALARSQVIERLETFLAEHSASEDLGVRLDGEQLAAGVRFIRIAKEGSYDVVVGNPPYQGLSKTTNFDYVVKQYPRGKADLYAAFLERGLELVREGGISALVTMRGWMFLGQFKELREHILANFDLRCIGDFDRGAFDEVPNEVLAVSAPVIRRAPHSGVDSVAIQPTPFNDTSYDRQRTNRKRAAVLAQVGRYEFDPKGFEVIEGEPIVYWWTKEFLERYAKAPKLGARSKVRKGLCTCGDVRFTRRRFELPVHAANRWSWAPSVNGGEDAEWFEPQRELVRWALNGLEIKVDQEASYGSISKHVRSEALYFCPGIAFTMVGNNFRVRAHRVNSIFLDKGSSAFPTDIPASLCAMNRSDARVAIQSLNPSVSFQVGDVNRLPLFEVSEAHGVFSTIERAFTEHESHREPSVEFRTPGPSPWRYAQDWAQRSVDRPEGAPLAPYEPEYDAPAPEAYVSFAIGVALGRFGANGEGILSPLTTGEGGRGGGSTGTDATQHTSLASSSTLPAIQHASVASSSTPILPHGILFVGPGDRIPDSLGHPAAKRIEAAWSEHEAAILEGKRSSLRDWLRKDFFAYRKALYENRPIYFPLSSDKKSFVAWVSIHRFTDRTLPTVLAYHVNPILRDLDAQLADLTTARASSDKKTAQRAEKEYGVAKKLRDELADFAKDLSECAERGAPKTDPACKPREVDAPFHMDLDDGVMINSAALWPLLAPQWNDPKKWWKQLCAAEGKKDYDWAHLAKRYFPKRVDEKCKTDPSLAVAHGCFWKYHPAKAFAWELRLQDEIRPDFTIDDEGSDEHRARFLAEKAAEAEAIRAKEMARRERVKQKREAEDEDAAPDAEADVEGAEDEA